MKTDLRKEHNKLVREGYYKEVLGCTCVNCGSQENIEYHHIVPLCVGGTNNLTNIAPVCVRCHKAIHGEKDYREYAATKKKPTRKPVAEIEEAIGKYIQCEIGADMLKSILETKGALSANKRYRSFLKSRGIKTVINKMDKMLADCSWPPTKGAEIGMVVYTNGKIESVYY